MTWYSSGLLSELVGRSGFAGASAGGAWLSISASATLPPLDESGLPLWNSRSTLKRKASSIAKWWIASSLCGLEMTVGREHLTRGIPTSRESGHEMGKGMEAGEK